MRQIHPKTASRLGRFDWAKLSGLDLEANEIRIEDRPETVVIYLKNGTWALLKKEGGNHVYVNERNEESIFQRAEDAARFIALERGIIDAEEYRP